MADDERTAGNREDALTAWLRRRLGEGNLLGDDAAVLPEAAPGSRTIATVDSQIAGVHHPEWLHPHLAARRLLAVNLSDLAAMGAEPRHALLALSAPPGEGGLDRKAYFEGLLAACAEHGVTLAGGDLARTSEKGTSKTTVATLTLLGELPAGREPLRRQDAEAGHGLWASGTLGESAAGRLLLARGARVEPEGGRWRVTLPEDLPEALTFPARQAIWRHLAPEPELALGRALTGTKGVGAAMDLSDGLAADLPRLCRASGVGARVDAGALPTPAAFASLCAWLNEDPLELALGGGEDYGLLFTASERPAVAGCRRIGDITGEEEGIILVADGEPRPLPFTGWDHLAG